MFVVKRIFKSLQDNVSDWAQKFLHKQKFIKRLNRNFCNIWRHIPAFSKQKFTFANFTELWQLGEIILHITHILNVIWIRMFAQ